MKAAPAGPPHDGRRCADAAIRKPLCEGCGRSVEEQTPPRAHYATVVYKEGRGTEEEAGERERDREREVVCGGR